MLADMVTAFRELDEHPHTVFTVLTGEGRFFSAGADIRRMFHPQYPTSIVYKLTINRRTGNTTSRLNPSTE